jgi:hypothetical protein
MSCEPPALSRANGVLPRGFLPVSLVEPRELLEGLGDSGATAAARETGDSSLHRLRRIPIELGA